MNGPRFPNRLIRASAGTGKTFQLSNRYLQLVLSGHAPERILASTFTRKAAGEILERILYRLAHAAIDERQAQQLARQQAADATGVEGLQVQPARPRVFRQQQ